MTLQKEKSSLKRRSPPCSAPGEKQTQAKKASEWSIGSGNLMADRVAGFANRRQKRRIG
jgi:hypothetical protein